MSTSRTFEIPAEIATDLSEGRSTDQAAAWAASICERLDLDPCGVAIPLRRWVASEDEASSLALKVANAVCASLRDRWGLGELYVEADKPQISELAPGKGTRALLPHHDGGNASFLTPSRRHAEWWREGDRATNPQRISTTRAHKLYQGFMVRNVGDGKSVTPYYDIVSLIYRSALLNNESAVGSVKSLSGWLGANVIYSLATLRAFGAGYIQLSSLLGARSPLHLAVNLHHTDSRFTESELAQFPELNELESGEDRGRTGALQLLDRVMQATVGMDWAQACDQYEARVHSSQYDLVLGHNIILMHGGLEGGARRVLDPICFAMPQPGGDRYEAWLEAAWEHAYSRARRQHHS